LSDLEILPFHPLFSYAPWYGSTFEILIFTAILAFQFKLLSDERLALQAEVAKEKTARLKEFFHGQEKERERIARELHDHVAGTLVGARFLLPSLHQLRNQLDLTQLNFYEKALSALDQSIHDVRNISHQLLPPSFQETSLQLEMEKLVSTYRLLAPATYFSMTFDVDESRISPDIAMTLYRISQESLQNIHKHAHASSVWMHICLLNDVLQLRIEDNGRGFDPANIRQGIGLHNFKSRISAYDGASFKLHAAPGSGTRIELDIPIRQKSPANKVLASYN
jgi:signal transduction histidine kinase